MEIGLSDLIAFFSLIIAFFAYRHTVKSSQETARQIRKISDEHLKLSSNVALSEASQKYVILLREVSREFEKIVGELSYPALEASRNIGYVFDRYDSEELGSPYLRHAFHEAITIVHKAYDRELTYQTGLNLTDRIRFLKFIKKDVASYKMEKPRKSIFSLLRKQKKPNSPEEYINSSTAFWDSVKIIYDRISSQDEPGLFKESLSCMDVYRKLHQERRERLKDLENRLDEAIKENALELFDIRGIPNLGKKFYRIKGDIDRYRELCFPDFYGIDSISVYDGIAYSLYAGSILFIASQYYVWGEI